MFVYAESLPVTDKFYIDFGGRFTEANAIKFYEQNAVLKQEQDIQTTGYGWVSGYYALNGGDYFKLNVGASFDESTNGAMKANDIKFTYGLEQHHEISIGYMQNAAGFGVLRPLSIGLPSTGIDGEAIHFIPDGTFSSNLGHYFTRTYAYRAAYSVGTPTATQFNFSYTPHIKSENRFNEPFYAEKEARHEVSTSFVQNFNTNYGDITLSPAYSIASYSGKAIHAPQAAIRYTLAHTAFQTSGGCFMGDGLDCRYGAAISYHPENYGIGIGFLNRDIKQKNQFIHQRDFIIGIDQKLHHNVTTGISFIRHENNSRFGYCGNSAIIGFSVNL